MHPASWVESLFGSRARVRILRALATDVRRTWTERELAAQVGMSPNTVNLALRQLRDTGILDFRRVGRTHALRLKENELTASIQEVFAMESRSRERMVEEMRNAVPADVICYLFGSTAKGTAGTESDVDLLVVADTEDRALEAASEIVGAAWKVMPAEVSVVGLDARQARSKKHLGLVREVARTGVALSKKKLEGAA